jgi:hypothetical protein
VKCHPFTAHNCGRKLNCSICIAVSCNLRTISRQVSQMEPQSLVYPHSVPPQINIVEDAFGKLDQIGEQLEKYRKRDLRIKKIVFKEELGDICSVSITDMLIGDSMINRTLLEYDKWHRSALLKLEELHNIAVAVNERARELSKCLLAFDSTVRGEIMAKLQKQARTSNLRVNSLLDHRAPIEEEIRIRISSYKFPLELVFNCDCESAASHPSQCSALGESYLNTGLDYGATCNQLTIRQLEWVEKVLKDLAVLQTPRHISNPRQKEVLHGLLEYKSNILAQVASARLRHVHPSAAIRTIITSEDSLMFHSYD